MAAFERRAAKRPARGRSQDFHPSLQTGTIAAAVLAIQAFLPAAGIETPEPLDPRLEVRLFSSEPDIVTPIGIDVDDRGRIWVIESNTHFRDPDYPGHVTDRILIMEDLDRDGRADRFTVFTEGFEQAMAIKLIGERSLLIATRREILRLEDSSGDGRCDLKRSLVRLETPGNYPHNGLSGFAIDDLGNIHFSLGENLGEAYRLAGSDGRALTGGGEGGSIYRMRSDGGGLVRWATGFWNTFHLTFDAYGNLFAVDNDPDSRPPCRLLHIIRGGDYGYRFRLGRKGLHPFTSWNGELPGTLPMVCGTGEAPAAVVAYEHAGLPEEYRSCLLVTSWGDHRIERYRLERRGASFRSRPEAVVQGGEMFRPVGMAIAPDGSIYFSDWVDKNYHVHRQGRIWQLRAKEPPPGAAEPPRLDPERLGPLGAEGLLSHPIRAARERAVEDLARHPQGARIAREVLTSSKNDLACYHALVNLARSRRLDAAAVRRLFDDDRSPEIAAAAVRLLGEIGEDLGLPAGGLEETLRLSPRVQLEILLAAGAPADLAGPLAVEKLARDGDPFLRGAALAALERIGDRARALELARSEEPALRLGALLLLRRLDGGTSSAGDAGPLEKFLDDPDPEVLRAAIQWAGEEHFESLGASIERAIDRGPRTREILDAALAAIGLLRGEDPRSRDEIGRNDFLLELASDAKRPGELRLLSLRSVSPRHPGLTIPILEMFLGEREAGIRREAARSLRDRPETEAFEILRRTALDPDGNPAVRREAAIGLAARGEAGTEALVALLDDPERSIRREAARCLRGVELPPEAKVKALALDRESGPAARLEPGSEAWKAALLDGGDPAEGEILFHHPRGARCASCHVVQGRGGAIGPDLSAAGRLGADRLLESILDPGKEIAPQFAGWLFITRAGPRSGIILAEEPDGSILLGNAEGETERIPPGAVLSHSVQKTSIMPERLLDALRPSEACDLMAYLRSLK